MSLRSKSCFPVQKGRHRSLSQGYLMSSQCTACKDGVDQPFPFSMAFQPIVDFDSDSVFAYEALVRGPNGESAATVLSQITPVNRYAFDQNCRVQAITLAARLGLAGSGAHLSINFMPGAVYSPVACIQLTLRTALAAGFPTSRLIFEVTENEQVIDPHHLQSIATEYRRQGFKVAIDDFGASYSGLNLLADLRTDYIKLDMQLTRNLHQRPAALAIVTHMVSLAQALGSKIIAEGVETIEEFTALRSCGVSLMQGYLFAKPAFEALPAFNIPVLPMHSGQAALSTTAAGHPLQDPAPGIRRPPPLL
jgi:EAL domain-containing protein (putative c-di-GMP-specific phosphodiesterase class I)